MPAAGFELHQIAVEGVSRSHPLKAPAGARPRGARVLPRSRSLLRSLRADAVLGGGGYVSAPVGLAALSLRVPLVLTEADSHLGLSNRLLAPFARRVCLAFPIAGRERAPLPRHRPSGPGGGGRPRRGARERFGIPAEARCVLVFGGSLGARSINLAAVEAFAVGPLPRAARLRAPRLSASWPRASCRRATTCSSTSTSSASARRSTPPTWRSPAPAARCSSSRPTACRRSSCPTRTPPATTRAPTPAGWPRRARARDSPTGS